MAKEHVPEWEIVHKPIFQRLALSDWMDLAFGSKILDVLDMIIVPQSNGILTNNVN